MAGHTFPVRVVGDNRAFLRSPTAVMVEVRGPDRALIDQRMVWVNDQATHMRLGTAGPHAVRATLGSGRMLHEDVDYNGITPPVVDFFLDGESPHETLQRTATVHRLRGRRVGSLSAPRYLSTWVRLWQRDGGGWEPAAPSFVHEATEWNDDAVRYNLELEPRQYVLEVGGPRIIPVMTSLPGMGITEVAIRPITEPDRHPIELSVVPASGQAATLLGYLATGAVEAIESILTDDPLVSRLVGGRDIYVADDAAPTGAQLAEMVLYQKFNDPNTAALGGYHLLRTAELERLHTWPANLANWIEWMSDGPIIRGWQLLRGGIPRKGETPRQRFLQAVERGLPVYAEGLRLLIDGLKVLWRETPDDADVAQMIETMGRYAAAADWSQAVLTFTGDGPDTPTSTAAPTARVGHPETLVLFSMTVEDLVVHRLLRPGTRLRATPRPARQIGASWTDETVVTRDGLLESTGVSFSDPNDALIGTDGTLMDGWYTWSTPDGVTLDGLRQEARRQPPVAEGDALAAPLTEAGIPTRGARLLAAAGISSVGELLDFGLDRIEAIAGIGPRTAAAIRHALTDRGLTPNDAGDIDSAI